MNQNIFQLSGIDQIIAVHGIDGAMNYQMGPNCRAPLFDDNEDVFYIKSTDKYGVPTVKRYKFEEEVIVSDSDPKTVSLQDIRSIIKEELSFIKEELANGQQPVSKTIDTTPERNDSTVTTDEPIPKSSGKSKSK